MRRSKSCVAADNILLGFSATVAVLAYFRGDSNTLSGTFSCGIVATAALVIPFLKERWGNTPIYGLYILYVMPAFFLLYPTINGLARALHTHDFDAGLIRIDQVIFGGTDPTRWMSVHLHPPPFVVELLQICYSSHYFLPLLLVAELALSKRFVELESFRMVIVYGAVMSFIGNMLVPAIGPRITVLEFANLQHDLPGLWLTDPIRDMINSGEGLRATMTSAEAMRTVFRDAFPSGHTMLTLMTILTAFCLGARVRWILLGVGTGLISATLILHYHYVIDVLAGALLAILVVWSAPTVANFIGSVRIGPKDRGDMYSA